MKEACTRANTAKKLRRAKAKESLAIFEYKKLLFASHYTVLEG
jgi:hypothetical protein